MSGCCIHRRKKKGGGGDIERDMVERMVIRLVSRDKEVCKKKKKKRIKKPSLLSFLPQLKKKKK